MTHTQYVAFDLLDDLHDGSPSPASRIFNRPPARIVRRLPRDFSLRDVYRKTRAMLEYLFPDNTEIHAAIRAGLQTLRDAEPDRSSPTTAATTAAGTAAEPARRSAA